MFPQLKVAKVIETSSSVIDKQNAADELDRKKPSNTFPAQEHLCSNSIIFYGIDQVHMC